MLRRARAGNKALVTGGAGFIGSHVCATLVEHGHEVVSFDRSAPGARRGHRVSGVRYRIGDHEDLGQVAEVADGVIVGSRVVRAVGEGGAAAVGELVAGLGRALSG